jgi:hypothetical protein
MVAYVMTGSGTLRDIGNAAIFGVATARAGGDTFDTNGFNLTIDQDSRYGLGGTTSTALGSITINATKGGNVTVDGRYVRMIPFTGGSGTITAGTLITCGSGTGKVVGIYSALTAAPVLTGVATGWIKVTEWNSVAFPTSGAFTQAGYTFTISGASIVGFIEVNGDEASTIVANRLGTFSALGAWFELGNTTGVSNQTLQIPNNGAARYCGGVYIEKSVASGTFDFYPNAGLSTTTGTEAARGKVCWVDATGLVRLGNSGAATNGYTPVSGLRVVIGNIFFENNTTAARTANVIPNATLATRYDFTTTGGGVVVMSKVSLAWYLSFAQPYSVTLTEVNTIDAITVSEVASPMTWIRVGIGKKPTTELVTTAFTMSLCFAGGTFTECNWAKGTNATAVTTELLTDIAGFTFVDQVYFQAVIRANASAFASTITRAVNCLWTRPYLVQGALNFVTCTNCSVNDTVYIDCVSGTTVTTYVMYVWQVATNCNGMTFSGLTMPITNAQPYTALLSIAAAGCSNIKLRNIGTYAAPLSLGTVNNAGLIYTLAGGAAASDVKVQRVYCSNTRTGIMTGDNSSTRVTHESVFGDYADATDVSAVLNYSQKGTGGTLALTAQTAVYGTHWFDCHTSATVSRIGLLMNEPTSLTTTQVALTGGAAFTAAGGLYMPTIGMTATFTMPAYTIGHTGFANSALVMAGGTATNYTYRYQIDKNDGAGFSAFSAVLTATTLGTALNGIAAISAVNGFKLKLEVTTGTANTTAITSMYVLTASTTATQAYQYPLDVNTVTFSGFPTGTDIVILTAGTATILASQDSNPTTSYAFTYSGAQNVDVGFIKAGYVPYYIRNLSLTTTNVTLPVSLTVDRNYI